MSTIVNRTAIRRAAELRKARIDRNSPYKVPMVYDRELIRDLLTSGHSLASVASIVGCSTWPVQLVKKEMKQMGFIFNEKKGEQRWYESKS